MLRKFIALAAVVAALAGSNAQAIVGGQEADPGEYPWMAAVYKQSPDGFLQPLTGQYCGGSLVAPKLVVTAAHCYFGVIDDVPAALPSDPLRIGVHVMLGETALNGEGGERIRVVSLDAHPNADMDLAVLELETASSYTPITPAAPGDAALFEPGTDATIVGWGALAESGSYPNDLYEAEVPIVADGPCGEAYADGYGWNAATMICAGYPDGGIDTCQGDSGGPMAVPAPTPSGWLLVGATSFGEGCAREGFPGVYAEVAAAKAFIDQHA